MGLVVFITRDLREMKSRDKFKGGRGEDKMIEILIPRVTCYERLIDWMIRVIYFCELLEKRKKKK